MMDVVIGSVSLYSHRTLHCQLIIIAAVDISGEFSIRGIFDNGFKGESPGRRPFALYVHYLNHIPSTSISVDKALNLKIQRLFDRRTSSYTGRHFIHR